MTTLNNCVWVFVGEAASLPAGVFATLEAAEQWIGEHKLTGILSRYPIDIGLYEWAVAHQHFVPTKSHHLTSRFIESFTSAHLDHFHYCEGVRAG